MLFRFYYAKGGEHTHIRVFAGKGTLSLGLAGVLTLRNEEWDALRSELAGPRRYAAGGSDIELIDSHDSTRPVDEGGK